MTSAKSTFRRRRTGGAVAIPKYIGQWFAGERAVSFQAGGVGAIRLRDYWAAYKDAHPDATPPANFELFARNGDKLRQFLARREPQETLDSST